MSNNKLLLQKLTPCQTNRLRYRRGYVQRLPLVLIGAVLGSDRSMRWTRSVVIGAVFGVLLLEKRLQALHQGHFSSPFTQTCFWSGFFFFVQKWRIGPEG